VYEKFKNNLQRENLRGKEKNKMNESYMTVKEFCEKMQVSSSTVYRMIKNKQIPSVKFGRYWKIPRSYLDNISYLVKSLP
jgi:excisionase family DNA binding protein